MSEEALKQRINYLVEHGGLYPESRPPWLKWAVAVVVIEVVSLAVIVMS